jgi:hypothetical protein
LQQLTASIFSQNKEAIESNNLHHNKILNQISQEESKKDHTQKIHTSIIKMIYRVAVTCSTNEAEALPATDVGLLAPSQRYSTIVEEEACLL